jgi:hypothetical protein
MPPSLMDDGPEYRGSGGGCAALFAFWLVVGIIAGIVTLVEVLF